MQAFLWTQQFVTGLARVDDQHRRLVDLVNAVGDMLVEGGVADDRLKSLFDELARYAQDHFLEEESLMARWQVDARHSGEHARHHREFVEQLVGIWERRRQSENAPALLHGFLASWLTMHILGEDQRMARMIFDIEAGLSPADAYSREHATSDPGIGALLAALYQLYGLLASQNRELLDTNLRLEEKVAERTRSLAQANERLQKEQVDLRAALEHIEASNQHLLNAEKMASLARLIAGFAHEMNTPIGVAIGATSNTDDVLTRVEGLLNVDEVDGEALMAHLAQLREGNGLAMKNLQRAIQLVQRIRQSALEQDVSDTQDFDLLQCLEDVLTNYKAALAKRKVQVEINCPRNFYVRGQLLHYEQVIMALIDNALRHAFPTNVEAPRIEFRARQTTAGLELSCSDNGSGISSSDLDHIFEPFFTTQRGSGRPGLGLYLCYSVVTSKLGGTIGCTSSMGKGSTFTLNVPVSESEVSRM